MPYWPGPLPFWSAGPGRLAFPLVAWALAPPNSSASEKSDWVRALVYLLLLNLLPASGFELERSSAVSDATLPMPLARELAGRVLSFELPALVKVIGAAARASA